MSSAAKFFTKCVFCKRQILTMNLHQHIRDEHS